MNSGYYTIDSNNGILYWDDVVPTSEYALLSSHRFCENLESKQPITAFAYLDDEQTLQTLYQYYCVRDAITHELI